MLETGIAERLVRFAQVLVGHVRGGLAHVNVLASVFFAGISGSALADAAGLGKIEIRMMQKAGYDAEFSAAVTAASATVGPIIPPSILMVIYAVVEPKVSIGGVFTATEAGAAAVVYALVVGLFVLRTLKLSVLPELLVRTGVTTATVLLIIGMANAMSWLLATQQVPQALAQLFTAWSREPWIFLLLVNACMLIVGTIAPPLGTVVYVVSAVSA